MQKRRGRSLGRLFLMENKSKISLTLLQRLFAGGAGEHHFPKTIGQRSPKILRCGEIHSKNLFLTRSSILNLYCGRRLFTPGCPDVVSFTKLVLRKTTFHARLSRRSFLYSKVVLRKTTFHAQLSRRSFRRSFP